MPVAQANPDGEPSYPGSLRVSGIHRPSLEHWWGWWQWPGKGNFGCMALQAPNLRNSGPNVVLTLKMMLSGQHIGNENWLKHENGRCDRDMGGMWTWEMTHQKKDEVP